jgi:hypothetical protein
MVQQQQQKQLIGNNSSSNCSSLVRNTRKHARSWPQFATPCI